VMIAEKRYMVGSIPHGVSGNPVCACFDSHKGFLSLGSVSLVVGAVEASIMSYQLQQIQKALCTSRIMFIVKCILRLLQCLT
jgi:hypothetical protein